MEPLFKKYGPYALITGASSGIGKCYAHTLADHGFNLILTSRKIKNLNALSIDLQHKFDIHALAIQADLSLEKGVKLLMQTIDKLEIHIGLLINNAGDGMAGSFFNNDIEKEKTMLQLNVLSPLELTHHYGNKMMKKGKGAIIWIGSSLGIQGAPYLANYAATKAYGEIFCMSLQQELKGKNIDVQVVAPGAVNTAVKNRNGVNYDKLPLLWMEPEEVVHTSFNKLGKKTLVIPGIHNKAMALLGKNLVFREYYLSLLSKFAWRALGVDEIERIP